MPKEIIPIFVSDTKAIGQVQDPVMPSGIRQTYYTNDWFGSSGTTNPVVIRFNEPMYTAVIRVQYQAPNESFAVGPNNVILTAQQIYAEAYDVNNRFLGIIRAYDGNAGQDMGFYTLINGERDLQLDSQQLLGIHGYISEIRLFAPSDYLTSFLFIAGTTKTANDQSRQTAQEYLDYIAQQEALIDIERHKLIDQLKNNFELSFLQTQSLDQLKRLKAVLDFESTTDLSKLSPEQAQAQFTAAVKKIDAQIKAESIDPTTGFQPSTSGPGLTTRNPLGSSTIGGSGGIGDSVSNFDGLSNGPSLSSRFNSIFNPGDSGLSSIQANFANAVQDYVNEKTAIVNSQNSPLVSELKLIRLLLEKIIGA